MSIVKLDRVNDQIIHCRLCPRLTNYIDQMSTKKSKRFMSYEYWNKPVPSFGDVNTRLLIIG